MTNPKNVFLNCRAGWYIFVVVITSFGSHPSWAQAQAHNPEDDVLLEEDVAVEVPPVQSPVVTAALSAIRRSEPKTPSQLIKAVSILHRLGAQPEAQSYLDQVLQQQLDQVSLVQVHDDIGTATLVQMANDVPRLSGARDLVHRVFAAVNHSAQDPERLKRVAATLLGDDAMAGNRAVRDLAFAGAHAVPVLLDTFLEQPVSALGVFDRVVVRLGKSGEEALIAALGAPDSRMQTLAARGVGLIGSHESRLHLIRPYLAGSDAVPEAAARALNRLGGKYPTSREASAEYLRTRALALLSGDEHVPADFQGVVEMWTWNAERSNVVSTRLRAQEAAIVMAARLARDVFELSPTDEHRQLLLATRLQVDQLLTGTHSPLPRGPGSAHELGSALGPSQLEEVLQFCLTHELDAATIGVAELIGDLYEDGTADTQPPATLVGALKSPNRQLRFAAVAAIMKIDPRHRFAGSSFFFETLIDLANASGRATAIVATPRTDVRDNLAGMLGSLGLSVSTVAGSRELATRATASSDIDVILLSDAVSRPDLDTTIQLLRNSCRSKLVPVIVLTRSGSFADSRGIAEKRSLVLVMPEFGDQDNLVSKLAQAEQVSAAWAVPPERRLRQATQALLWLRHLAEYSQTYSWYDLLRARDVAIQAANHPSLRDVAIDLLGFLGDDACQKRLVDMASQFGLPVPQRQRAANAFAESVLRRGLRLHGVEVQRQYDRNDGGESSDPATQEILGQILDVIETQTRPASLQRADLP